MFPLPEPLRLYHRVLVEEFLRELRFLMDARAGIEGRPDFTHKLLKHFNDFAQEATGLLPGSKVAGAILGKGFELVVDWANDKSKEGKAEHMAEQSLTLDEMELKVLVEAAALEACRRYQYVILVMLSEKPLEGVVEMARVGARRMLEYVGRRRLPLSIENLVDGLIAGHSGGYVDDYSNTQLIPKEERKSKGWKQLIKQKVKRKLGFTEYTAEGAYGRSGLITRDGELFALGDKSKARHKVESESKLERAFNYGYTKFIENTDDPKYGYLYIPNYVVNQLYGHIIGKISVEQDRSKLSSKLQENLNDFKPLLFAINRQDLEKYCKAREAAKTANKPEESLLDYIRRTHSQGNKAQYILYDVENESDRKLTGLNLSGANLNRCCFINCEFEGSLAGTSFQESYLQFSDFSKVMTLEDSDFSRAHLAHSKLQGRNLAKAILTQTDLSYADLRGGATLPQASNMVGAIWHKAIIEGILCGEEQIKKIKVTQEQHQKMLDAQQLQLKDLEKSYQTQQSELKGLKDQVIKLGKRYDDEKNDTQKQALIILGQMTQGLYQKQQAQLAYQRSMQAEIIQLQMFQTLEVKITASHGERIQQLEEKVGATVSHGERIEQLKEKIKTIKSQDASFQLLRKEVQLLGNTVLEQKENLKDLDQRIKAINEHFGDQAQQVTKLEGRMNNIQRDFDDIQHQIRHAVISNEKLYQLKKQAQQTLKNRYLGFNAIKGLFGKSFQLEGQYINLQMIYKAELNESKKEDTQEIQGGYISSNETIKPEDLFKPDKALFSSKQIKDQKQANEVPIFLLIKGMAGVGKTTFVHYVGREWAKAKLYSQFEWTFTLTLRELHAPSFKDAEQKKQLPLWLWIYYSQFQVSGLSEQDFGLIWLRHIEPILKEKVLLILDGFDEVPDHHSCKNVLQALFEGEYAHVPKIITSRPYGLSRLPLHRRDLEIRGFTDDNIEQYVRTYFNKEKAESILKLMAGLRSQPILWRSVHIPINLNLICGITEESIGLSSSILEIELQKIYSMSSLYTRMERQLFKKAYEKGGLYVESEELEEDPILLWEQLEKRYRLERHFLAELAFLTLEQKSDPIILSRAHINIILRRFKKDKQIDNGKEFLAQVRELGLINPVVKTDILENMQNYEFIHLTFQDYYAAIYIVKSLLSQDSNQQKTIEALIIQQKLNPRWQTVCGFVAGLLEEQPKVFTYYMQLLRGNFSDTATESSLTNDLFQYSELGLLARCIDEGETQQTKACALPIRQRVQAVLFNLYQLCSQKLYDDVYEFQPSFITLLQLSPHLLKSSGANDVCVKIPYDKRDKRNFLNFIQAIPIASPKVLAVIADSLADLNAEIRKKAVDIVNVLGAAAATPEILKNLSALLKDANSNVRNCAASAVGTLGAAVIPEMLEGLSVLLMDKDSNTSAVHAVRALGAAAATPKILEGLNALLVAKKYSRGDVVKAIGALGVVAVTPKIFEHLSALLEDENRDVRSAAEEAVRALGVVAMSKILDILNAWLVDGDRNVRSRAALVVRTLGAAAAKPKILASLRTLLVGDDRYGRCDAANAVGMLGEAAATPEILEGLSALLVDKDSHVRSCAANAVRELGVAAISKILEVLGTWLRDENRSVRRDAANAVGMLGAAAATPEILESLNALLMDEDSDVRSFTANVVGMLGAAAAKPKILKSLSALLIDKDRDVCKNAARAIGAFGAAAAIPEILDYLSVLLVAKDRYIRSRVAEVVGMLGEAAAKPNILKNLSALLADKDPYVRSCAADTVGMLGATAAIPEILEGLSELLKDKESDGVADAKALGVAVAKPKIKTLHEAFLDNDYDVRSHAVDAVGMLGAAAAKPKVLKNLSALLMVKGSFVRCRAADTVGMLGATAATPEILEGLNALFADEDSYACSCAVDAVGMLGAAAAKPKILESLSVLLEGKDRYMCRRVAKAVGKLGAVAAIPRILKGLSKMLVDRDGLRETIGSPNSNISGDAVDAVRELGMVVMPKILEDLSKFFADKQSAVRYRAMGAVSRLGAVALPAFLQHLSLLLENENQEIRSTVAEVLRLHIPRAFISGLGEWLQSSHQVADSSRTLACLIAGAYLSADISLRIYWSSSQAHYLIQGFVSKEAYQFSIIPLQTQILRRSIPIIIEQLQTTGKLNNAALITQAKEWPPIKKDPMLADSGAPILKLLPADEKVNKVISIPSESSSSLSFFSPAISSPTWESVFASLRKDSQFALLFQPQTQLTLIQNKKAVDLQVAQGKKSAATQLKLLGEIMKKRMPHFIDNWDFDEEKLSLTFKTTDDAKNFVRFAQGSDSGLKCIKGKSGPEIQIQANSSATLKLSSS